MRSAKARQSKSDPQMTQMSQMKANEATDRDSTF
jgi:hypothetical protein